jgi:hypothetical protein
LHFTQPVPPRLVALLLCTGLSACADTLEDRLAELDERAIVDCGWLGDCASPAQADVIVACLRDNLGAGVGAKAGFELGIEEIAHVYALDGSYVSIVGYYYEGNNFTEFQCRDLQVTTSGTCGGARAVDCDKVRDWH